MRARPLLPAIRTRRAVPWLALLPLLLTAIGCGVDEDPPPEPVPPVDEPDDPAAEPDEPSPDLAPETVEVEIYLSNDTLGDPCTGEVFPVPRTVAADDPLTGALEALLAGPTDAERDEDYWSWFSDETEGMLRSVEIVAGTVMVDLEDLRPVIPNASTSCGSSILLSQLDTTTLAAAEGAASVLYLIEGEHDVFYEWLQLVPPGQDAPDDDASGTDTDLADGRHAVLLHAADLPGRTLTVDVIQFLTGEEARIAYAEDHPEDPHGPPNGYHIRNVNPRLRTLPVATDTEVILIQLDADPAEVASSWEALLDDLASQPGDHDLVSYNPFWLTLEGGVVTRIEEQFVP